jgi:radical SAM protein with 4Fe4S-binding SPASM domain
MSTATGTAAGPKTFIVDCGQGTFPVRENQSILDATRGSGIAIPHTCGGEGKCLTCRFELLEGEISAPNSVESANLDRLKGKRLSCQNTVTSDLKLRFEGPVRLVEPISAGISWEGGEDGPQIQVAARPNPRLQRDRAMLVAADRAPTLSQAEMNAVLKSISESDALEIKRGTLRPAPVFDSEGWTDEEFRSARRRERLLYFNMEFTNRCNLACTGCFAGFGDVKNVFELEKFEPGFVNVNATKSPLELAELYDIIDQAADLGAKTADLIGGGEPLSSPIFFHLAERAVQRGMQVEVFTNGTLIDRKKAEHMAALKVVPYVKLYSTRSWVHDQMVGVRGGWRKVVEGIDNLMDAGYGGDKLPISLESIVVRKNLEDLPTMWRYARERGMIPYFERFVGCHYDGDPGELLSPMELKHLWEELWLLDRGEYGFTWPILPLRVGYSCLANFYSLYVNYEGDVRPCSGTFVPLGNTRQSKLAQILAESPVVKDLREYERPVDSWCASCYYYESDRCPGCRGMAQAKGSYMADDPLCFHNPRNLTAESDPRNTPHLSKMPTTILKKHPGLFGARDKLLQHPIYLTVDSIERLRVFMEDHVFAVWDFMSVAKRLQRDLTCVALPWTPSEDPGLARFINEIIHSEESDEGPDGVPASHLELYLSAMREVGADTTPFLNFLGALKAGSTPAAALRAQRVPKHVSDFVLRTLDVAMNGHTVEVAADFLYGREDIIPEMFQRILLHWNDPDSEVPTFKFYLERHIELDGGNHGPAARRMLERLAGDDENLWDKAALAAQGGIDARIRLWEGIYQKLGVSSLHAPPPDFVAVEALQ